MIDNEIYAILPKCGMLFTVECHHYEISEGWIRLFTLDGEAVDEVAAYNCDDYTFIVKQTQFTEAEILEQMKG